MDSIEVQEAATRIRKMGRSSVAILTEVRLDEQIRHMVRRSAGRSDRLIILVNNAGGTFAEPVVDSLL